MLMGFRKYLCQSSSQLRVSAITLAFSITVLNSQPCQNPHLTHTCSLKPAWYLVGQVLWDGKEGKTPGSFPIVLPFFLLLFSHFLPQEHFPKSYNHKTKPTQSWWYPMNSLLYTTYFFIASVWEWKEIFKRHIAIA